ncbi:MAG: methylmalonyl Co-A mutase-associated GTPase MeaB [Deltaproteobacteria bacterium]|nr:methylmalonyl Co-A mutase-associated GTPase MeaB [Deltaproteobacteria bacterium]MBW2078012.1 methylmalonyl Co-A mutase-associated GTPase MeaB [Deltaproteobacteria bacterium]MBW2310601.1 methylmalonyl Co-A mutase-associated GTPase MeaB [Deltaproteobacteria bacterium]
MSEIVKKVASGDIRAVAKLIRDIDDKVPEVREVLKDLYPFTGKAYVVGITGAPGVGKSTLVDQMVTHLRGNGQTVGILAVDPTSPFSGGAILGDRVRMQRHSLDEGVFIRSMATRGYFGGLTQSTRSAIDVLDAMGKDYILVETVGVGQDEIDIVQSAHTTIIVLVPGMGDDIQALKAGILEVGDIFVVNKADREGTDRTVNDLRLMIEMDEKRYKDGWKPPILTAQAVFDKGIQEILEEIENHKAFLASSVERQSALQHEKARHDLTEMIKDQIIQEVLADIVNSGEFEQALQSIAERKLDPYTACDTIVSKKIKSGTR